MSDPAALEVLQGGVAYVGDATLVPDTAPPGDGRLLTAREAAAYLGVARQTLANWRAASPRRGPSSINVRGRVFYRVTDLDAWTHNRRYTITPVR